mmetsp:Transcript_58460/g.169266  ORF Transcript_58460/g.169266 Transcript_58460/m.169266 type:complete len:87 (+) Transcript_58460:443-703(+)
MPGLPLDPPSKFIRNSSPGREEDSFFALLLKIDCDFFSGTAVSFCCFGAGRFLGLDGADSEDIGSSLQLPFLCTKDAASWDVGKLL